MDTQPTPNIAKPEIQPSGMRPEDLLAGSPEQSRPSEVASAPAPPPAAAPMTPPPAKLTPDDVAAAIAAVPGPLPPPMAVVPVPQTADDVDVIEPEWVAKAEDVVRAHQGDPYGEEAAIEELQQDYLQKRYGHNVANPGASGTKPEGS